MVSEEGERGDDFAIFDKNKMVGKYFSWYFVSFSHTHLRGGLERFKMNSHRSCLIQMWRRSKVCGTVWCAVRTRPGSLVDVKMGTIEGGYKVFNTVGGKPCGKQQQQEQLIAKKENWVCCGKLRAIFRNHHSILAIFSKKKSQKNTITGFKWRAQNKKRL